MALFARDWYLRGLPPGAAFLLAFLLAYLLGFGGFAGASAAALEWRTVEPEDEQIVFRAEDLTQGSFVRTSTQRMGTYTTIEVGKWSSPTADAGIVRQVAGDLTYLYSVDPGEYVSKVLKKALDWGPEDSIRNQLGPVSYRLAKDGGRSCIAFAIMYSYTDGTTLPSSRLAGYYCTENELRPQQVIACLGEADYGVPACPVSDSN